MYKTSCTICGKEFEGSNPGQARQKLIGHANKSHGGKGLPLVEDGLQEVNQEKPQTVRDILLQLLNEPEISVEIRLKYALRILSLTE